MQKQLLSIFMLLFFCGQLVAQTSPKLLVVVSGYGKQQGKIRPGFELDELSQAYLIFKANGIAMDIASPKGGPVEADKHDPEKPYNKAFLALPETKGLLENTRSTSAVKATDYQAIYIVGGKGTAFDLPFDPALQELVVAIHAQGGLVSAVCHGPAAFAHVKKSDGTYWAAGKKMTGFTNAEEAVFGKRWKAEYPFLLEEKLKSRGAQFEQGDIMLPYACTDQNVVTGQNPYSTTLMAEAVVRALGRVPVDRELYSDEKTMQLLQSMLEGQWEEARTELRQHQAQYDLSLLAMYGYLRYKAATNQTEALKKALELMNFADEFFDKPELDVARADAYRSLGQIDQAKTLLEAVLAKDPNNAEAKQLLEGMTGK